MDKHKILVSEMTIDRRELIDTRSVDLFITEDLGYVKTDLSRSIANKLIEDEIIMFSTNDSFNRNQLTVRAELVVMGREDYDRMRSLLNHIRDFEVLDKDGSIVRLCELF